MEDMENLNVASATECTGLVPALTDTQGEAKARALLSVTRVKRPHKRKHTEKRT